MNSKYMGSAVTINSARETDYAVREMDFYYGVRGPALSEEPGQRRLGTGPADPTSPVTTATSWIRKKLGLAKGKKERGFSVVRSSRAPEQFLAAHQESMEDVDGFGNPRASEIGVAVSGEDHRNYDSDTDAESANEDDNAGPADRMLEKRPSVTEEPAGLLPAAGDLSRAPTVPRKSSKRKSRDPTAVPALTTALYDPPIDRGSTSRLPFESDEHENRRDHANSFSTTNSSILEPPHIQYADPEAGRPPSVGEVNRGRISELIIDERSEFRGSQAELVQGGSGSLRDGERTAEGI